MSFTDPTAKQSSFETFYHYQPFCKDYLTTTLRDQKLFFSDPHHVNDPWDCKPWFDYRPMLEDQVKREQMIVCLRSLVPTPEMLAHPFLAIYEHRLRTDNDELKKAVASLSQSLTQNISTRRIYCLTPVPDSTLMWSHYAANHRGICLEFIKHNDLIGKARPVRYRETYPEWTPQDADKDILALVLTKSMDWCYEREYRIIASSLDGPTKLYGNYVKLPTGALTSIILGCESQDQAEVESIVREYAPGVLVKRAVRVANQYKLTIGI
jgi:hypothetical protein